MKFHRGGELILLCQASVIETRCNDVMPCRAYTSGGRVSILFLSFPLILIRSLLVTSLVHSGADFSGPHWNSATRTTRAGKVQSIVGIMITRGKRRHLQISSGVGDLGANQDVSSTRHRKGEGEVLTEVNCSSSPGTTHKNSDDEGSKRVAPAEVEGSSLGDTLVGISRQLNDRLKREFDESTLSLLLSYIADRYL